MSAASLYGETTLVGPEQLPGLLQQVTQHKAFSLGGGVETGYIEIADGGRGDEPDVVLLGGLNSHTNWTSVAWEAIQAAQANPHSRVLALDMPGHGNSSKPTRKQALDFTMGRSVQLIAEQLAETTIRLGVDVANVQTRSTGSLVGIEMAAQAPGLVHRLYGIEPTGTEDRSSVGMWRAHMSKSPADLTQERDMRLLGFQATTHTDAPFDDFEKAYKKLTGAEKPQDFWFRNVGVALLTLLRTANASELLVPTIEKALLGDRNLRIGLDFAEASPISNRVMTRGLIAELPLDKQERIDVNMLPDEGHEASSVRFAPRMATRARAVFTS